MDDKEPTSSDQILDLLLDALQERLRQREARQTDALSAAERPARAEAPARIETEGKTTEPEPEEVLVPEVDVAETQLEVTTSPQLDPLSGQPESEPRPEIQNDEPLLVESLPRVHLDQMLRRLAVILVLLLILVNIPFNRYGTSLARAMPDSASLIIRDGLLLKGGGDEVYVLENNRRRWITTLEAFEHYGYRWSQVHQVEDDFLNDFELGLPIHLLLKCQTSPHIYALEDGKKRWIKDIPTFEAQGYLWDDVQFVSCDYLRRLPDGPPIPEDAGPPPQPEG